MERDSWAKRNVGMLIGWALQLVLLGVYIGRQEAITRHQDDLLRQQTEQIRKLEDRVATHHEDVMRHVTVEWRERMMKSLDDLNDKLDKHQSDTIRMMRTR